MEYLIIFELTVLAVFTIAWGYMLVKLAYARIVAPSFTSRAKRNRRIARRNRKERNELNAMLNRTWG